MKLEREIEITNYLHYDLQVNLESLGNALHRKDYYGKEAISEPQVGQFFSRYLLEVPYFEVIMKYMTGADDTEKGGDHFGNTADESSLESKMI